MEQQKIKLEATQIEQHRQGKLQSNIIVKEHRTRERNTKIKSRNRNKLKPLNKYTSSLMSWRTETNDTLSPLKLIQLIYCPLPKAPDVEERIPQYRETSKQKEQLEPLRTIQIRTKLCHRNTICDSMKSITIIIASISTSPLSSGVVAVGRNIKTLRPAASSRPIGESF